MEGSGKGCRDFPPVPRRIKTSFSVKAVDQSSQGYAYLDIITKRTPLSIVLLFSSPPLTEVRARMPGFISGLN
jgi:hypothetical protein